MHMQSVTLGSLNDLPRSSLHENGELFVTSVLVLWLKPSMKVLGGLLDTYKLSLSLLWGIALSAATMS